MKRCITCGKIQDSNNTVVCSACGGNLENVNPDICPFCQKHVTPGVNFCNHCGRPLTNGNAIPQPQEAYNVPYEAHYEEPVAKAPVAPQRNNKAFITLTILLIIAIIIAVAAVVAMVINDSDDSSAPATPTAGNTDSSDTTSADPDDDNEPKISLTLNTGISDTSDKEKNSAESDEETEEDESLDTSEEEATEEENDSEKDNDSKESDKKTTSKKKVIKEEDKVEKEPEEAPQSEPEPEEELVQPQFDTPKPQAEPKPAAPSRSTLEVSVDNYVQSFVYAMTYSDSSYMQNYVIPGCPLYTTQANFIKNGWYEEYVDSYIVGDIKTEDPNTCVVSVYEIYNVRKSPDDSLKRTEQTATYRMKKDSDGYWKMYDFVGSVKSH